MYHKERLPMLVNALKPLSVQLFSTGGTARAIESVGGEVTLIESLTQSPPMLGGRVKTLHPRVFGGVLARRDDAGDLAEISRDQLLLFDWVIVDLYPFSESLNAQANHSEMIEKIDIGGVSLIRAAAKNYRHTLIISSEAQIEELVGLIKRQDGVTSLETRRRFAQAAFALTAQYDQEIHHYFVSLDPQASSTRRPEGFTGSPRSTIALRYGENPHQSAHFTGDLSRYFNQIHGPDPSYNNLVDLDAAIQLIEEFPEPTCAILKHTNPCGIASREDALEAFEAALSCDPTSAFGGVIISNLEVDLSVAQRINELFYAVLAAPSYTVEALQLLTQKRGRVIVEAHLTPSAVSRGESQRSVFSGVLTQTRDDEPRDQTGWRSVTQRAPTEREMRDLVFALRAVKHLKSNAISLVKNARLIGMGCGQPSRIDALNQALEKAQRYGFDVGRSVLASDAFFPFSDCVKRAGELGVSAIVQPGGSRRDQESVDAANALGIAMMMTGTRHFRH